MIYDASEADEPVTIVEYNPLWPALFDVERARVMTALGDIVTRIAHFGSTAVPGMAGKPIADLLIGVREFATAADRVHVLEALGYENFGEIFISGRLYLRKRGSGQFHAAVTADRGDFWSTQIIVRAFLRTHPAAAAAYAAFKRSAYAGGARLSSTYSQAKDPFPAALRDRARNWHGQQKSLKEPSA